MSNISTQSKNSKVLIAARRTKTFQVEIRTADTINAGKLELSVTHNGYQWNTLSLTGPELKLVLETLVVALK